MLGTLHLFVKFFVVLALLHWLTTDFWVMYGHLLLVIFGFWFLPHAERLTENICKINHVGLDTCLAVYLTIFCTYAYIIRRLNRGSLLPNAFRGLPGWFAEEWMYKWAKNSEVLVHITHVLYDNKYTYIYIHILHTYIYIHTYVHTYLSISTYTY